MTLVPTLKLTTSAISLGSIYLNKTPNQEETSPIINENNKNRMNYITKLFLNLEEPNLRFDSPKELDELLAKKKLQYLDKKTFRQIFINKSAINEQNILNYDANSLAEILKNEPKLHSNLNIRSYLKKKIANAYGKNLFLIHRMVNKPEKFKKLLRTNYYKDKHGKESSNNFKAKHSMPKSASEKSYLHEIKTKTNNLTKKISIKENLFANTHKKSAYNSFHNSKLSIQSKSKTSQSLFINKFGQINESYEETSENSIFDLDSILNEISYLETQQAWSSLKNGVADGQPELKKFTGSNFSNFFDDTESIRSLPDHNIPYASDKMIENDAYCFFCKENKPNEAIYPCRICTKVFHIKCIEQKGLLRSDQEKEILLQAFSNIGWSCYECSNLGRLVPASDIYELIEQFEFSDVDHDYGISSEEFLRIRKEELLKQFGIEMSHDDIEVTNLRFKLIDADKSGYIDWDEYLNYECMKRLHHTPARELVTKLTPKEIQQARETFFSFDRDKGGTISEEEARRTFRHWFTFLHQNQLSHTDIDTHVQVHTELIMQAGSKRKGELTWEEFIKEQAIYILVNRPNNPIGLVGNSQETKQRLSKSQNKGIKKDSVKKTESSKLSKQIVKNKKLNFKSEKWQNISANHLRNYYQYEKRKFNFSFSKKTQPLNKTIWCINEK